MRFKSIILCCLAVASFGPSVMAATDSQLKETALKMVPDAKVVMEDGNEFTFQTSKGTLVEVEMNRDGSIDEASGGAAANGDVLSPANGLMSLTDAVSALEKAGKNAVGDWSLEKSMINGWVYEFEGVENGKKMEYAVDAKDGKLIKNRLDL